MSTSSAPLSYPAFVETNHDTPQPDPEPRPGGPSPTHGPSSTRRGPPVPLLRSALDGEQLTDVPVAADQALPESPAGIQVAPRVGTQLTEHYRIRFIRFIRLLLQNSTTIASPFVKLVFLS